MGGTKNRVRFCTHPTCRNTNFVPKPRLWYVLRTTWTYGVLFLQEETRSELFWGETGLKIRPDVFRHDNCERISYLF
jgi:hypothetical protein